MARRGSISEAQVFEAAEALRADGKEVSASAILARLGSGSFTTIYKHMGTWEAKQATVSVNVTPLEIPPSVQGAFVAAWRAATSEAGREVAAVREKASEEIRTAQKQLQETLETIEQLEKESDADGTRIEELTEKLVACQSDLQKAGNEKSALEAAGAQLRVQVKSQDSELERVHREMEAERNRYKEERTEAARTAASAQQKADIQIERLQNEIAEQKANLSKAQRERDDAVIASREASSRADRSDESAKKSEQNLESMRKEKDITIQENSSLRGQIEALTGHNKELLSQLGPKSDQGKKPK